ncbi:hypothetical protein BC830DRAFT_1214443 [Chytriomyces sp. MP71]|nr:hypothetical protein BC830DRAFT_1214443 [Chytriomyces sp. MP71]
MARPLRDGRKMRQTLHIGHRRRDEKSAYSALEGICHGSVDLPTDIMGTMDLKKKLQEWDGVMFSNGILYLLEANHDMLPEKISKLDGRVASFRQVVASSAQKDVFSRYVERQIVGVACGTRFSNDAIEGAARLGIKFKFLES